MFARDEHDHIIGRIVKLAPIGLGAERVDVRLHGRCVGGQMNFPLPLIHSAKRVLIGIERNLGVDHERIAARHPHNHVRAQATALPI